MSTWTLKEILMVVILGPLLVWGIYTEMGADNRPESVKYVETYSNGCKLDQVIELANHQVHVRHSEYRMKKLELYKCSNNTTAALIKDE